MWRFPLRCLPALAALLPARLSLAYRAHVGVARHHEDPARAADIKADGGGKLQVHFDGASHEEASYESAAGPRGSSPDLKPFLNLMAKIRAGTTRELEAESLLEDFYSAEVLMARGEVSEETWTYAWKHLPSVLMDFAEMRIVFHAPHTQAQPTDQSSGVYTFAGWETDGGAYTQPATCNRSSCRLDVNVRDVYSDVDEFLSNLLLHIRFLAQNPKETFYRCHDQSSHGKSCRGRGKCWLAAAAEAPHCEGELSRVEALPKYKVSFEGFEGEEQQILEHLRTSWRVWSDRLQKKATALTGCSQEDLKVHVIQGATEAIWVMTSQYAMQEQPKVDLTGSYGGRFEEDDRRYASFLKASKADKQLFEGLNAMNKGRHDYDPQDGPLSVNTELIALASWKAGELDPVVTKELLDSSEHGRECGVLLNVGYPFGTAAWPMGLALKDSFGKTLKSFYAVGKAGGLVGKVGDYQVPSSFFLWESMGKKAEEEVYKVDTSSVDLTLWSGGRKPETHSGALMTVPSVVLQTHQLLDAAKANAWKAVGIEMESFWFKKALPDVPGLYLYYTSDLPQGEDSSLAHESYPWQEGQTLFNGLVRMAFVHMLRDMGAGDSKPGSTSGQRPAGDHGAAGRQGVWAAYATVALALVASLGHRRV